MTVPYIVTGKTLTLYLSGGPRSVEDDHPMYARIVAALRDGEDEELEELILNPCAGVAELTEAGEVLYNGEELHNVLVERIQEIANMGLPHEPMLRFLENLMENPSETSRDELFEFLAHSYLPITEDGHFLGYKAVTSNLLDIHSRTYDNTPGEVISMPRSKVDPDRHNHCSAGFHVGTMNYVRYFGGGDSRYVLVKVNPADAVSVPADHNAEKLRCCKYEVVREIARDEVLQSPVYNADGSVATEGEYDASKVHWDYELGEDDDYDPWAEDEDSSDLPDVKQSDLDEYRESRTEFYDKHWNRDMVVAHAAAEGLVIHKEAGRSLGKAACIALIVGQDAEDFFS